MKPDAKKDSTSIQLTDEQIRELEKLTGVRMTKLVVETEPFERPPLGTPVLGKIFTDPRTQVVRRVNAVFET
jgi:GMP synthase PP-ATPase subunit